MKSQVTLPSSWNVVRIKLAWSISFARLFQATTKEFLLCWNAMKSVSQKKIIAFCLTLAAPAFFGLVLPWGRHIPPPPLFNSGRVELWTWNLAQWYSAMLQIKWHKKNFNMVASFVITSLNIRTLAQNYAKSCKYFKNWDCDS